MPRLPFAERKRARAPGAPVRPRVAGESCSERKPRAVKGALAGWTCSGPIRELTLEYVIGAINATPELPFPPGNSAGKLSCCVSVVGGAVLVGSRLDLTFQAEISPNCGRASIATEPQLRPLSSAGQSRAEQNDRAQSRSQAQT